MLSLCYPVLYTIRLAGILCIVFVIHGLVSRKTFTVVIIVLELWSSICKEENNFEMPSAFSNFTVISKFC